MKRLRGNAGALDKNALLLLLGLICLGFFMLQMVPVPEMPSRRLQINRTTMHVFICTDEKDLRPVVVAINSTFSNAKNPQQIRFHVLTDQTQRTEWHLQLKKHLPTADIDIVRSELGLPEIKKHISFRRDSRARLALTSPFNFLPFYLPRIFPTIHRLVYIDSDVVVKGDIEELFNVDLKGRAAAAVEDCSQKFSMYFNFVLLEKIRLQNQGHIGWLPKIPFDPKTCIFNRGVLVMDVRKWIKANITDAIEWWLDEFHQSAKPLYKYGVSQPPFLLALYGKYQKLDVAWNVRGLGRNELSEIERDYMEKMYGKRPQKRPFYSPNVDNAKILHYNGKFKPWRKREKKEHIPSLCGWVPRDCAELWWFYLSSYFEHNNT